MDVPPDPEKEDARLGEVFLLQELLDLAPRADILDFQILALTVLAGIVALGGLFLNSPAIIIGAMVINPLLEPIYAGTVFLANGVGKKFIAHVKVLVILAGAVILTSALITTGLTFFTALPITPEILSRMEQQEVSAVLAILLGIIAIVAHKRGFVTAVIGVGISVALIPPVVVTGICIVLMPERILDAFTLVLNNILGLFAGMLIAVIALSVGPREKRKLALTRANVYLMTFTAAGLLLVIFLLPRILRQGFGP
jgi:uncharacterized hydrophobic protein (TIGR00341 family)